MNTIVLSGGFDPVHDGHIAMFEAAAKKYEYVVVGLNSDKWLQRKKRQGFYAIWGPRNYTSFYKMD